MKRITYSMAFWVPVGWMEPDTFLTGDDGLPKRQPGDAWDKTLICDDGVHPSGGDGGNFSEENLKVSGYALRTWVNFLAVRELYFRVLSAPKTFKEQVGTVEPIRAGIRCEVTADTQVSRYADANENERIWNWGAADRLKSKGWEEYTLLKFDTSKCKGLAVKKATLYLSRTDQCVINVTISTDWPMAGTMPGTARKRLRTRCSIRRPRNGNTTAAMVCCG